MADKATTPKGVSPAPGEILTRQFAFTMVLVVQFLLGMTVNLFVKIPSHHPGAGGPDYFVGSSAAVPWAILHGGWALGAHVVLGTLLFFGALRVVVPAVRSKDKATVWTFSLSAFFIWIAVGNGASFLVYNEEFSSMIMATAFAAAVASNVTNLYLKSRPVV